MRQSRWNALAFAASLVLMAAGLAALPNIRESNGIHVFPDGIQAPIADQGGQVFNVKSYGAVGDGSADDTAALRRALSAASGGGTIYFPCGTYLLNPTGATDGLDVEVNNVTLRGANRDCAIITFAAGVTAACAW